MTDEERTKKLNRMIEVSDLIKSETEKDVAAMEGAAFNGKVVAEAFGNQAAAIVSLAGMVKTLVELQLENG